MHLPASNHSGRLAALDTPGKLRYASVDEGISVCRASSPAQGGILTHDAVRFVADLTRCFRGSRNELLKLRAIRQKEIDAGTFPDYLAATAGTRDDDWSAAPIPDDLVDRRVEIVGPVDRSTVIDALASGANVYVADFDDANAPTWHNCLQGQVNLRDVVYGDIAGAAPYRLPTLVVRPRGWHSDERHLRVDGEPVPAAIFDFGMYIFHNAHRLLERGAGPYFYLPKLEGHLEARLWNDVFVRAQDQLGIPRGTIRATVLVESVLAVFEMDEILFELKEHASGLALGRWDYTFSFIKRFRNHPEFVFPDRDAIASNSEFLCATAEMMVTAAHRRGVHAIGGMAPLLPGEDESTSESLEELRRCKRRELDAGLDGTWIGHPDLVIPVRAVYEDYLKSPNQISRPVEETGMARDGVFTVPSGDVTERGLRVNVGSCISYLAAWLSGHGRVSRYNLLEDTATAEIARALIWQWLRHPVTMDDGRRVTHALVRRIIADELEIIETDLGRATFESNRYPLAGKLLGELVLSDDFAEFITLQAYDYLD